MFATALSDPTVREKYDALIGEMRKRGRILVAFSGGVDSGLVLKLAHDAVGGDCMAVIADSPSLPRSELAFAKKTAADIGVQLEVIRLREMEREDYRKNTPLRCYFCRSELGRELKEIAASRSFTTIADGANVSDLSDYRPGMKATDENGFWHPLVELAVDKETVRSMVRNLGLDWHEKPSSPCLSSRIMTGERITERKLRLIEEGEELLHEMGFPGVRVRFIKGTARIEVPLQDVPRLLAAPQSAKAESGLKRIGFLSVTIDSGGYRSGSMNARS